jgi:hypothetical protein
MGEKNPNDLVSLGDSREFLTLISLATVYGVGYY